MGTCGLRMDKDFICVGCSFMIKGENCIASDKARRKIGCPIRKENGTSGSKAGKGVTIDECVIGQEYWLDGCMDESGIYAGNGKWIPTIRKYYLLDKDGLIELNKGLFYPKSNNAKVELENKIRIPIPTGYTAKIENNTVIFEPKTAKFKKGDFVIGKNHKCMAIFREYTYAGAFSEYVGVNIFGSLLYGEGRTFGISEDYRLMTDSEKQTLLDKLHEFGKDWDEEKCEIVDWVWKPKSGDLVYYITQFESVDNITYLSGSDIRPFRTRKLAESALELLKQAKHY